MALSTKTSKRPGPGDGITGSSAEMIEHTQLRRRGISVSFAARPDGESANRRPALVSELAIAFVS
jgi:hypothetical protein